MPRASDLTAENQLLLCCARAHLDPESADRLQALLLGPLDWQALTAAADRHGVLPLLFRHLSGTRSVVIPSPVLGRLRERTRDQASRNLGLTAELLAILDSFSRRNLVAIPFKGPALSALAYGDLGLRQSGDLDLLIRPRDLATAAAVLHERRYRCDLALNAPELEGVARYGCELVFRRGDLTVELHWRLAPAYFSLQWPFDDIFERRTTGGIGRHEVPALADDDLLLALCVHGTKDAWQRLVWLADVAEVVRTRPIAWPAVMERARDMGAGRLLRAALAAARALLACDLPARVTESIDRDRQALRLADRIRSIVFRRGADAGRAGGVAEARFHLGARERVADRVRYCLRAALTPTIEDQRFAGAAGRWPGVTHVVRPVRLLAKYGSAS